MSQKFKTTSRCYLVDHHSPQPPAVTLDKLDIDSYEKFFKTANIDSLMLYCKDHWGVSYYDSNVQGAQKHLGIKIDWVEQMKDMLQRNDIEFIAYYCIEYDEGAARRFPQWRVQKADGMPLIRDDLYAKWSLCCYQTDYRHYCLSQLKEIVGNYKPDALFLDIFGSSLCYCPACRTKFERKFGYPLPEAAEAVMQHRAHILEFLESNAEEFLTQIKTELAQIDPTLALTINFSCHYPHKIRRLLDYQFSEPLLKDNWFSAAYARDTAIGQYPILAPGEASQVYNYESVNQYIIDLSAIAAQGCRVGMYSGSQHIDGTLDFEEARRLGAAYKEIEAYKPYLIDRKPVKYVGILQSDISMSVNIDKFYSDAILRAKRKNPHINAILGAMQLCEHAKIPWGIIPEQIVSLELLQKYTLIILPEVFIVSEKLADVLGEYVRLGGHVILSGSSGLYNENAEKLKQFTTAELIGASYRVTHDEYNANDWDAYLTPFDDYHFGYLLDCTTPPVSGSFIEVFPTTARGLLRYILPCVQVTKDTWVNWWSPPPGKFTDKPALLVNQIGKGTVHYFGFSVFNMAAAEGYSFINELFAELLKQCALDPPVENLTDTPDMLRTAFFERSRCLIVHQLSMLPKRFRGETVPVKGGTLSINKASYHAIRAQLVYPMEQQLTIQESETKYLIELPWMDLQQIVRIDTL